MPEPSPESGGRDFATALADDEHAHALTPASAGVMAGGVFSGPESERVKRKGIGVGGWFCVATNPFPCPADGCSFVAEHMTAAHLILVWQERDDPNLLRHAGRAKAVGRNPHVVTYEPAFGPSASYYAWEAAGRLVHGVKK